MKRITLLILTASLLSASPIDTYVSKTSCDKIINKQVVDICYDYSVKGAKYVRYSVLKENVNVLNIRKRPRFYSEKNLPSKYRTKYADYTYAIGSEDCDGLVDQHCELSYDRGHLAPDADFDYDKKVLRKIYTMANIIPQVSVVNQKTWTKVEMYERKLASSLGYIDVITGVDYENKNNFLVKKPLFMINTSKWKAKKFKKFEKQRRALAKKKILIPSGYWKAYSHPETGFLKCFYYENVLVNPKQDKLRDHEIDCGKVL